MKVLFLDESGDHNLAVIDPQYPLFVLGGVIMEQTYAETEVTERMRAFKRELFGREDLVLHTADLTRNRNGFGQMQDTSFREHFYGRLNFLVSSLRFTVVACAVRKLDLLARYGVAALDPYLISLDVLVERFAMEVGTSGHGIIVAERRDPTLDHQLELAWLNLKVQGTRFLQAKTVEQRILGLNLRSKKDDIAGLQLADLVVSPIGRQVLGKPAKADWKIVESKLRKNAQGDYAGYGLVVLPK